MYMTKVHIFFRTCIINYMYMTIRKFNYLHYPGGPVITYKTWKVGRWPIKFDNFEKHSGKPFFWVTEGRAIFWIIYKEKGQNLHISISWNIQWELQLRLLFIFIGTYKNFTTKQYLPWLRTGNRSPFVNNL